MQREICPICDTPIDPDELEDHVVSNHLPRTLAGWVVALFRMKTTQAATIQAQAAEIQSYHGARRSETATRDAELAVSEKRADNLYETLQGAVNRLANVEAERDQALEEAASLRAQLDSARDVARGTLRMANDSAAHIETTIRWWQEQQQEAATQAVNWFHELEATRKQLAQVLEQVAGARLAVNKALAVGEVDAAHLAGLNGYGDLSAAVEQGLQQGLAQGIAASSAAVRAAIGVDWSADGQPVIYRAKEQAAPWVAALHKLDPTPVVPHRSASAAAYLSVEANGRWINRYLLEMEPGTLYPPATGRHDTANPLSVTTCPACETNTLQCFINEHEQGYIVCAQCHQQIATVWPVGAYNSTAEAREALPTQPTADDPNWPY